MTSLIAPNMAARPIVGGRPETPETAERAELREAANALEASFLAEMLRYGGAGRAPEGFGGGAGEAAFSGELVAEQARRIVEAGGIGLADALFESLLAKETRE